MPFCPTMLSWKVMAENNSLYNTPPCFAIYMAMLNLRHLKKLGGVKEMQKLNEYKAGLLYDFIDSSSFYVNRVNKQDRSLMNVPFNTSTRRTQSSTRLSSSRRARTASSLSRVTGWWAACALPSITPCPWKASLPSSNS